MSECSNKPISINLQLGRHQARLFSFCRQINDAFRLEGCGLPAQVQELRLKACAYVDRPTKSDLKLMLISNVLLDLASHGWSVDATDSELLLCSPSELSESPAMQKERIRQRHLIERDAQLREPSVQEFIKSMERKHLTAKGWHSIYSVMRDGEELSTSLCRIAECDDLKERTQRLTQLIDPYLQFVTPEAVCPQTGLRLNDIWRYFRHTWVNAYRSVPGRNLMILVRDRAAPNHPVIGIAALASSVIQQSIRDKWIGWDSDVAVADVLGKPTRKKIRSLLGQLRNFLKGIYVDDLIREGFLTHEEIKNPSPKLPGRLRSEATKRIKLHQKNPEAAAHKSGKTRNTADWVALAETNLYRSKRCKQLSTILEVQQTLRNAKLTSLSGNKLRQALQASSVKRALRSIVRMGKAERVGIQMMDIMVCGAIAPYNSILGGKLICLLLGSPEVIDGYARRYKDHVSVIASGMKGRKVKRKPGLVLLCTTSLYGNGSSQYNRVKLPADIAGGHIGEFLRYEELGTSEGFGSFHFSKETLRIADSLLGRSKQGRKVNSIFGEGVNPLMRKMREALSLVGLPSDLLLRHGNKRIVYGVPLARNFRSVLLGYEKRPKYLIPQTKRTARTSNIAAYWIQRWLSKRIEDPAVLQRVGQHSLIYPIRHGARVELSGENPPETPKAMAAVSAAAGLKK